MQSQADQLNQVRNTLAKMEVAFSALQDAIVWTDQEGNIQWCNQAFVAFTDTSRIMLIGKQLMEVLPLQKRGQPVPPTKHPATIYNLSGKASTSTYELVKDDVKHLLEISGTGLEAKGSDAYSVVMILRDITNLQIADEIKTQGLALSAAANAIVITDQDGLIEWVNPAFVDMTGYTEVDCLGQPFSLLKSGCQNDEFYRDLWDTITSGNIWKGELVNRRKDGSFYHEEETITPVLDNQGAITHYIAIKQDISERKQFEAMILEREAKIQAILDGATDAIVITDEKGVIESYNDSALSMFGYSGNELVGQNVKVLIPKRFHSAYDNYLLKLIQPDMETVTGVTRELQAIKKDGSRFPIEISLSEAEVKNGMLVSGFIRDISKRKIAETGLKEARQQLQEANNNLLAILDESNLGVFLLDAKGQITFVNNKIQMFLKRGKELFIGKNWRSTLPLTKEHVRSLEEQFNLPDEMRTRVKFKFSPDKDDIFWGEIEMRDDPRDSDNKILFVYDVTEVNRLRSQLSTSLSRQIIGSSKVMKEMLASLNNVATGDWTVLIEGETGVGKELVANAIHAMSARKDGPFIAINCGGLTSSLLTSQLFGYRKGAFTGASVDQVGLFEAANGGTLFLDEIGDVPLDVQVAMLRVLEEREVTRVGDTQPRKIDVRVLAATNRDLVEEVAEGRFRNDLLYRIRVARISVPSLRERLEDIPLLVNSFLLNAQVRANKRIEGVDPLAMQVLQQHYWPGNIRELKNAIDISAINCKTQMIRIEDLPKEIVNVNLSQPNLQTLSGDIKLQLETVLQKAGGNRSKAAKLMGVSRATFYRRLVDAGIETKQR